MISGKNVRLREYRKTDVPKVLDYLNNWEVRKNLAPGVILPYSLEQEEGWYASNTKDQSQHFSFAIERISDSEYLGGCGYNAIDWKNSWAIVGVFLGQAWLGQGYGTEAMELLINHLFFELNLNKVKLNVYSFNKRAIRSYEKLGFKTEGVLRQEIFREGKFHDELVMSVLRSEWELRK